TRVDVFMRELPDDIEVCLAAYIPQLVLHEDQVPDFQVSGVVDRWAAVDAVFGSAIIKNFRTRATRAGLTGMPIVISFADALRTFFWDSCPMSPARIGFFYFVVLGDPYTGCVQPRRAIVLRGGQ